MKQGRTIVDLVKELERQRTARKDYIADTRMLTMKTDAHGNSLLSLDLGNTSETLQLNELAQHLDFPLAQNEQTAPQHRLQSLSQPA